MLLYPFNIRVPPSKIRSVAYRSFTIHVDININILDHLTIALGTCSQFQKPIILEVVNWLDFQFLVIKPKDVSAD